jgi:putative transposase
LLEILSWLLQKTSEISLSASALTIVTVQLQRYGVAHRELMPDSIHDTSQYANNHAELSHQPTRVRERGMRRFKSIEQGQRLLAAHAAIYNLFNLAWRLISAENYRFFKYCCVV